MPYAPQVEYRGDRYLFTGIADAGRAIGNNVRDYIDRGRKSKALDSVILAYAGEDPEQQKHLKSVLPGLSFEQKEGMVQAGAIKQRQQMQKAQVANWLQQNAMEEGRLELAQQANKLREREANRADTEAEQNATFNRNLAEGLQAPGAPTHTQLQRYYEATSSEEPNFPKGPTDMLAAYANALRAAPNNTEAARALPALLRQYQDSGGAFDPSVLGSTIEIPDTGMVGVRTSRNAITPIPKATQQAPQLHAIMDPETGQVVGRGIWNGKTFIPQFDKELPPAKTTVKEMDVSSDAPKETTTTTYSKPEKKVDVNAARERALDAIKRGAAEEAVKKRFKELTGEDL